MNSDEAARSSSEVFAGLLITAEMEAVRNTRKRERMVENQFGGVDDEIKKHDSGGAFANRREELNRDQEEEIYLFQV